ncbi:MAG TPA: transglycosylase SLT domain-containing protein [Nitrospiria bacterium]
MRFSGRHRIAGLIVVAAMVSAWPAACSSPKKLVVPTTPPSERNENPTPDHLPFQSSSAISFDCNSAQDCFTLALSKEEEGDRPASAAHLRFVRTAHPDSIWARRAGFLLGKWSAELGSVEADDLLKETLKGIPALEEYALFYRAGGQETGGRFEEAHGAYDRLLKKFPDSLLAGSAIFHKSLIHAQLGDCRTAVNELNGFLDRYPRDANAGKALLQISECTLKIPEQGDSERGLRALQQLRYFYADRPEAEEAGKRLEALAGSGVSIPIPSIEAQYRRGRILHEAARYEDAAAEFRGLLKDDSKVDRDDVRLRLSESLIQLKQYDEARSLLEQVADQTASEENWTAAVYWLGRLAIRRSEGDRPLEMEKLLAFRSPASTERARLMNMIGDYYQDQKRPDQAEQIYRRLIAEMPSDPEAENAVWRLGWMAYRAGRYADAISVYEDFLARRPDSSLGGQFSYWIGRSAEQLGQTERAEKAYQEVCRRSLRSFYCFQTGVKLAQIKNGDAAAVNAKPVETAGRDSSRPSVVLPEGGRRAFSGDRHYLAALELLALRLRDEASRELAVLSERYASDKTAALRLAELYYAAGNFQYSLRLVRLYFPDVLEKGGDDVPSRFWEYAYPKDFVQELRQKKHMLKADPYLVAAVVREESAFDARAVSRVGAQGLMQLMPYTAEWVARQVGLKNYRSTLLMDEDVNIRLGSWYLQHLIRRFNGNWVLAVASYNAGPEAVERWMEKGVQNLDEFIESIPYSETRYYTKKVIRSYIEYRRVSGEEPRAQMYDRFPSP